MQMLLYKNEEQVLQSSNTCSFEWKLESNKGLSHFFQNIIKVA